MLMMKKPKNLEFEPVRPKNVLLASVVHGISCLLLEVSVLTPISPYRSDKKNYKQQTYDFFRSYFVFLF
jgi:hypothetical protein